MTEGQTSQGRTVLLVDDHPIVRAGCRRLLAGDGTCRVVEAESAEAALALYAAERPDVVVLDLNLPGMGGLEALGRLRDHDPGAVILIFSMYEDPLFAARALQAGARGYITKNDAPETLAQAIDTVLSGAIYLNHTMARELAVMSYAPRGNPLQSLTRRELDILGLLGRGLAMADIAQSLGISHKTVYNLCTQIKDKLGAKSTRELIRISIEHHLPG